ncbi:aminotransferase class III-fold pyridoxal phosphate-dependent enzyme [Phyllobacterium sp. SYP-B3895]|uniref:aminotransferase class III-fold pyridoxal phosphate-dependent enzyme n=1 Tax=Phyllobacterium sp. SYP-B3895 TaxID=2663240 RepID=UPI00129996A9|nr:aminotransferase class III-fold pyridoxal phosphate-dependent enzyme [Phyllobacterium sp. SYP-B3895]MRG58194.1 aminotransferase class III-fold pyridoxal phosphate-dependent enzyme [Phyllobacterium sp. SYP-B3895]
MIDLSHPAPSFSDAEALTIAREHFGIEGRISPLASERDQNFKIDSNDGHSFILKIVNASEPRDQSDFQTALLEHLEKHACELAVPRLRRALTGLALASVEGPSGELHAVRMVSWQIGEPLATMERTPATLGNLGKVLGELDRAMQGFIHAGALRTFDWDIRAAGLSRQRVQYVNDAADRALLERWLDRFDRDVAPRLPALRAAVIHNDANDWNVLVDASDPTRIAGLIDFGDALHSVLIAEVAVACAYSILEVEDPIGAAGSIVAGFNAQYSLLEEEVDLLFDLIVMRLVISVTMSAQRSDKTAENPYLQVSEAPAWNLLRRLDRMNPGLATAILRQACGYDAFPGAKAIVRWIEDNNKSFRSILATHPARLAKGIVPYGDPQNPMTVLSAGKEPEKATEWWDAYAGDQKIALGIGPWGEERSVYTGTMFESRFIAGTRRTRHLGLDLFMPAGTKLYTPIDAVVSEVMIEEDPLGYGCLVKLEHRPEGCPPFATLWGHLAHEAVGRLRPGEKLAAGDLIGEMGGPSENGGWVPHLHLQLSVDTQLAAMEILGVGEPAFLPVWAELFPDAAAFAGLPPETFEQSGRSRSEIVAERKSILLPNLSISYAEPIKFVRGEGAWLIDDRGRAYLDCFNNVCHLGHAHPDVVEALSKQAGILNTNTRYLHDNIVDYAERLTATLPGDLCVATFACSGSEANSLMLRMMRAHTGREEAIVLDWAYHGTTQELIDLSPYKYKRKGGKGRKSHVYEANIPDTYRAPADWPADKIAQRYAESVAEQIASMRKAGKGPGVFLAESIPSVAGQVFLPEGYLREVYAMVRAAGGICAADEVQVGFGRVGSHWWAFETQGVVPDIVTMGKPIGNGHPMAAVVTTREVAASFNNGMEYFNTFGGNPVSCAVGLAVLDVIERDDLRGNALAMGNYLLERFRAMQARYEVIGDVRGQGLFLGIELVTDRKTKQPATELARKINNGARERGVLMGTEGPHDNVLKLRPPMIFNRANADLLIEVMEETFAAVMAEA